MDNKTRILIPVDKKEFEEVVVDLQRQIKNLKDEIDYLREEIDWIRNG